MLQSRSTLAAGNAKRPRLIGLPVLLVFAALVGVALLLMFPYRTLMDQVLHGRRGDELSIAYLRNLLRTDPHNAELALRLAGQLLAAGDFDSLAPTLAEVLRNGSPTQRVAARLLLWHANEEAWRLTPEGSSERTRLRAALLEELRALASLDLDEQTRIDIADRAFELGDTVLGMRLYRSIRGGAAEAAPDWLLERAQARQGQGETDAAVQLYLLARARSASLAVQRECFFRAIRLLVADDRTADALELAERELGTLADDLQALIFMVELARSANAPAAAAHYARRMLRLSLRDTLERLARADGASLLTVADAPPAGAPPGLPFDDRLYTLGYDAFVGNRDLEDAYRVAEFAVRQAPASTAWRLRLAHVAEWSGRPQEALAQWQWLLSEAPGLSRAQRDEAARTVLRLAPGLFDDRALQAGLRYQLRQHPGSHELLAALIASFEHQGVPEQGVTVLQDIVREHPNAESMQALIDLAARCGRVDLAIATTEDLIRRHGTNRERALQLAGFHLGKGDIARAWAVLNRAQESVAADDQAFWRLLGELSLRLQHDVQAHVAYDKLVSLDGAQREDFDALIELLAPRAPAAAADLALRGAKRFDSWDQLIRGLELSLEAGPAETAWQRFTELDARLRARGEGEPRFLALRADAARGVGRNADAARNLERLLTIAPDDVAARQNLLWILIDGHEQAALRALLAAHEADWARDASLHDALAAAWQTLSAPHVALERYLTPRLQAHRRNFLWLMNYADALEQDRQPDLAWRMRAWLLRSRRQSVYAPMPLDALRAARTRLVQSLAPGDQALSALRDLLRLDGAASEDAKAVAEDLRLAWLLSGDEAGPARAWLWERYARHLSNPAWARTALAMKEQDWALLAAELDSRRNALMREDAIGVARAVGAGALAGTLAFEAQDLQRDDNPLQLQLTEVMLEQAPRASLEVERRKFGQWIENERRFGWQTQVGASLRLAVELARTDRDVDPTTMLVPGSETRMGLTLVRRDVDGETRLALARHEAIGTWTEAGLGRSWQLGATRIGLRLAWRANADESLALRALGRRDSARVESELALSPATRLSLAAQASRYTAQNGLALGTGLRGEAELNHRLGAEGDDTQLALYWNANLYQTASPREGDAQEALAARLPGNDDAAAKVATLMPRDYALYGLRWSTNTSFEEGWTRSIRPFASLALTYNTDAGAGYAFGIGLAGRLEGPDHLAATLSSEQGASSGTPRSTRISLRYWRAY